MTLYQIKPLFQSLLRPTMFWLYKHHVTANHITLAALALSLLTGLLLMLVHNPSSLCYCPSCFLFVWRSMRWMHVGA
ncbi:phosphatidylglycerophosphate synthase [Escherichia coli]|uniref:Phosphatidylglycerophosphate synthase n=1 Tax=Escherichia coli TaxID=562 RepID=A0A377A095_ECOLX|nr:phosphatidylglycerophosphate synthase [Escherichia coli]